MKAKIEKKQEQEQEQQEEEEEEEEEKHEETPGGEDTMSQESDFVLPLDTTPGDTATQIQDTNCVCDPMPHVVCTLTSIVFLTQQRSRRRVRKARRSERQRRPHRPKARK
jgi:hypothetical protein